MPIVTAFLLLLVLLIIAIREHASSFQGWNSKTQGHLTHQVEAAELILAPQGWHPPQGQLSGETAQGVASQHLSPIIPCGQHLTFTFHLGWTSSISSRPQEKGGEITSRFQSWAPDPAENKSGCLGGGILMLVGHQGSGHTAWAGAAITLQTRPDSRRERVCKQLPRSALQPSKGSAVMRAVS